MVSYDDLLSRLKLEEIAQLSRKKLVKKALLVIFYAAILIASIVAVVSFGSYPLVFVIGAILFFVFGVLLLKKLKTISISDYTSAVGEIENVFKDVKTVSTTSVGGVGLGTRRYDSYKKNEIRLTITIRCTEALKQYQLNGITEEQADYYESRGPAIHIWGTHFPIKLGNEKGKWICPVCGELSEYANKACPLCKTQVYK